MRQKSKNYYFFKNHINLTFLRGPPGPSSRSIDFRIIAKSVFEISFFRSSSSKYRSTRWSINQRHLTSRVGLSLLWYMDIWRRQIQKPSVLAKQTFFGETNNKTTHPTLTKLFPLRLLTWSHERSGERRASRGFLQLTSQFCCCCLVAV